MVELSARSSFDIERIPGQKFSKPVLLNISHTLTYIFVLFVLSLASNKDVKSGLKKRATKLDDIGDMCSLYGGRSTFINTHKGYIYCPLFGYSFPHNF